MNKKLKNKALLIIVMIVMMVTMSTIVKAEETKYSAEMSLKSDSKLKAGDTVNIQVELTNVNAGTGIDTITASLEYDSNIFEDITSSNLIVSNDWTPTYASSAKMLTLIKNNKVTSAETVLTIQFKVKKDVNAESTTVAFKDIIVSGGRIVDGGTGDIEVNDITVTINKEKNTETPTTPDTPSITENTVGEDNTINDKENKIDKSNSTKKDNTTTTNPTLPKTGIAQFSILAIVIVAVVSIACYISYKKIAKEVK